MHACVGTSGAEKLHCIVEKQNVHAWCQQPVILGASEI